jgi:mannose-6-phosphate isomerase-like protein (cupin superfamily)
MADAVILAAGDGETHAIGPGSEVVVKAGGEQTGGSLFMSESTVAPGFPGPPRHRHERLHEMFYVLDGTLSVLVGDQQLQVHAGGFISVSPGVVHTFSNPGTAPVRFLNINSPAGCENYMRDLGAAASTGPLTTERIGQIASRYDFFVVE